MSDDARARLDQLRTELGQIDRDILALVAKRQAVAQKIGQIKRDAGIPTRDYRQERDVVERARAAAVQHGLTPQLGEELILALIRGSRFGAALQAARQNEVRTASVGIAPYRIRLAAFALSGMVTGVAGALFADLNRFVSPSMLSWHMSGELIVLIILGGVGRLYGPVVGAALYVVLEYWLGGITERWQFFLGLVLLGVVLFARGGIVGLLAGRARHD